MTDPPTPPDPPTPHDCQSSNSAADRTSAKSHDWESSAPEEVAIRTLDARGLRCPLPVIRLAALLRDLRPGTEVVLLATDPAARSDVAAFCRMRGHELVLVEDRRAPGEPDVTAYRMRRGG